MFTNLYVFMAVDAIQDTKKSFVEKTVTHEGIKTALNEFIEAQRSYTKSALTAGSMAATTIMGIVASKTFFNELVKGTK